MDNCDTFGPHGFFSMLLTANTFHLPVLTVMFR